MMCTFAPCETCPVKNVQEQSAYWSCRKPGTCETVARNAVRRLNFCSDTKGVNSTRIAAWRRSSSSGASRYTCAPPPLTPPAPVQTPFVHARRHRVFGGTTYFFFPIDTNNSKPFLFDTRFKPVVRCWRTSRSSRAGRDSGTCPRP
jgi:hypothetical protein